MKSKGENHNGSLGRILFLTLLAAAIFTGCLGNTDTSPGDVLAITKNFTMTMESTERPGEFFRLPTNTVPLLAHQASWTAPDEIILEGTRVSVISTNAEWTTPDGIRHRTPGYVVSVSSKAKINGSAQPGEKQVLLSLPRVEEVARVINATPRYITWPPPQPDGKLTVQVITVHTSKSAAFVARAGKWVATAAMVTLILGLYVALKSWTNR